MYKSNKKELERLSFEISFCEELLRDKPAFVEALLLLGDAYTKRGLYHKGLNIDKRLARLKPDDPIVKYNLACSYSLVGNIDASIKTLRGAIEKGYFDFDYMKKDPDLENVRKDKRFEKLINKFYRKKGGDINGIWFIQEDKEDREEKRSYKRENCKETKTAKAKKKRR